MPGGSVVRLSNWRYAVFVPARSRAGLSDWFRIHDLRHYADAWVMRPAVKFPLAEVVEPVLRSA